MVTAAKKKAIPGPPEGLAQVDIDLVKPNPYQPASRRDVDAETAARFGRSILEHGLLQTPVCRQGKDCHYEMGDGWLRLSGYRWLVANGHADYRTIPVQVRPLTDQQMADLVMEANTVRKDLNVFELAAFYKKYLEDFGATQTELARRHNCSQGEIANTIRLLDLPAEIQGKVISGEITPAHARQLLRVNGQPGTQNNLLRECISGHYTVDRLTDQVAYWRFKASRPLTPGEYADVGGRMDFDAKTCGECERQEKMGQPYDNHKKTLRCLDPHCWDEKNMAAQKAKQAELQKTAAQDKVLDLQKLHYGTYEEFVAHKHLANPGECQACPKRVLAHHAVGNDVWVCINVPCFKRKVGEHDKAKDQERKRQEQALLARIDNATDGPIPGVVWGTVPLRIVCGLLITHLRADTRDTLAKMCGLPFNEKKRADLDGAMAALERIGEADLVMLAVTASLLREHLDNGENGPFQLALATMEGKRAEYLQELEVFHKANCKGCTWAKEGRSCTFGIKQDEKGRCAHNWNLRAEEEEGEDDDLEVEGMGQEGAPKEVREVDVAILRAATASYSAHQIGLTAGKTSQVQPPFSFDGKLWLCIGVCHEPRSEPECDCYQVVVPGTDTGRSFDRKSFGPYDGEAVQSKGVSYVMVGPEVLFKQKKAPPAEVPVHPVVKQALKEKAAEKALCASCGADAETMGKAIIKKSRKKAAVPA